MSGDPDPAGLRVVREERQLGGERGIGEATLQPGADPSGAARRLAGARAWLSVAQAHQAAGTATEACAAALSGIDELGDDYAGPDVEDDTTLKLFVADEAREAEPARAAIVYGRVLENRLSLFADTHCAEVAS